MRKVGVVLIVLGVLVLGLGFKSFADEADWQNISREILDVNTALVNPDNPAVIFIGTKNGIFKTEDAGGSWKNILSIRGGNGAVNYLLFDTQNKNSLYAATGNGLYYSNNQGKSWNRIFRGRSYLENECVGLSVLPAAIYLGTKAGLFASNDKGRSWQRCLGKLGDRHILAIAYNLKEPNYIYVASVDGVFKSEDAGKSWGRIFVVSPTEDGAETEEKNEDNDEEERFSNIRYISCDAGNSNYLYLATTRGIYKSQDKGQTWDLLTDYGLLNRDTRFLCISHSAKIYVATKFGVFEYIDQRWRELSLGLASNDVRFLAIDSQDNLYAACDKGLFRMSKKFYISSGKDNAISLYFKDEPDISKVQKQAIHYAEVEPEKIKEWRKRAKMKAVLPKLTVGIDRSESTNYEIYTSATTKYIYEGPYDKSNGWDVSLSWDLSELIWNGDQTSIDVRSRLMVQLRDDILDEVTKLYFERIRIKAELDSLSIEDRKKRFEKELKLKELTASLDALTGGYFSSFKKGS